MKNKIPCDTLNPRGEKNMQNSGIMLNEDPNHFYVSRMNVADEIDEAYLRSFIDQYQDTDVTDFLICANVPLSSFPSEVLMSFSDKYFVREELGQPVDYTGTFVKTAYKIWNEKGLDLFPIWIDQCNRNGIHPWISFRMNDAHCHYDIPNVLISQNYYDYFKDFSRVRHRRQFQYYDRCRDFAILEVRKEWIAYITETLERYRPYGIELDFQREFDCFQIGHEWAGIEIMTSFLKEVKETVINAEKRIGRPIKIAVRCHADPVYCMELGFDILKWAELQYIDMVIPSPRFRTTDNDMPIRLWKQMLQPYHVELAGAMEILVNQTPVGDTYEVQANTVSTALGTAANILSQGADKLYLFNYMDTADHMILDKSNIDSSADELITGETLYINSSSAYCRLLTTAGSLEKINKAFRRHIVTYQDKNPLWRDARAQLPCEVQSAEEPKFIKIATGFIPQTCSTVLKLGITGNVNPKSDLELYINSSEVRFLKEVSLEPPILTKSPVYSFEIPHTAIQQVFQVLEIFTKGKTITIDYVEIAVIPK